MTTKVVLIAGAARSGSTFLSQVLSQNDDCANVGQIRHMPVSYGRDRMCSCGQLMSKCALWGAVAASMVAKYGPDAIATLKVGFGTFQALSETKPTWSDADQRAEMTAESAEFLTMLTDLYGFTAQASGGRTLIDSSKLPSIGLGLLLAKDISLHVVNLIRDPRGVACSWAKLVKDPQVLRMRCRNWNKRLDNIDELEAIPGAKVFRLRYEDFTAAPRKLIEDMQRWAGLTVGTPNFSDDMSAAISWDRTHLFPPANEEVLAKKESYITIKASESWKSEANRAVREISEKVNFPKAEQVGYHLAV